MENRSYYRQKLPHIQPKEGTFFVTYRLFGSVPKPIIDSLKANYDLGVRRMSST